MKSSNLIVLLLTVLISSCTSDDRYSLNRKTATLRNDLAALTQGHAVLYTPGKRYRIEQQFRESGYNTVILLQKKTSNGYRAVDSLFPFRHDDAFAPARVIYDRKNNWLIYNEEASGTGIYGDIRSLVRIHNDRFHDVFSYPSYYSCIDVESPALTVSEVACTLNCQQRGVIRLAARYTVDSLDSETIKPVKNLLNTADEVVFRYDATTRSFLFYRAGTAVLRAYWTGQQAEPVIYLNQLPNHQRWQR